MLPNWALLLPVQKREIQSGHRLFIRVSVSLYSGTWSGFEEISLFPSPPLHAGRRCCRRYDLFSSSSLRFSLSLSASLPVISLQQWLCPWSGWRLILVPGDRRHPRYFHGRSDCVGRIFFFFFAEIYILFMFWGSGSISFSDSFSHG